MNKEKLTVSCDICGKPAQVRHFPGMSPQSGSWCDYHYRIAAWVSPNGMCGFFVWLGLSIAIIIFEIFIFFRFGIPLLIGLGFLTFCIGFILQQALYLLLMRSS